MKKHFICNHCKNQVCTIEMTLNKPSRCLVYDRKCEWIEYIPIETIAVENIHKELFSLPENVLNEIREQLNIK